MEPLLLILRDHNRRFSGERSRVPEQAPATSSDARQVLLPAGNPRLPPQILGQHCWRSVVDRIYVQVHATPKRGRHDYSYGQSRLPSIGTREPQALSPERIWTNVRASDPVESESGLHADLSRQHRVANDVRDADRRFHSLPTTAWAWAAVQRARQGATGQGSAEPAVGSACSEASELPCLRLATAACSRALVRGRRGEGHELRRGRRDRRRLQCAERSLLEAIST